MNPSFVTMSFEHTSALQTAGLTRLPFSHDQTRDAVKPVSPSLPVTAESKTAGPQACPPLPPSPIFQASHPGPVKKYPRLSVDCQEPVHRAPCLSGGEASALFEKGHLKLIPLSFSVLLLALPFVFSLRSFLRQGYNLG